MKGVIELCDQDIRAGRPQNVAKRLSVLNTAKVAREWRVPLAKVCRRAGLYSLGLNLLSYWAQDPEARINDPATPVELAEYAVLLMRSGATSEAIFRLNQIDAKNFPEVLLYNAYGHFYLWEYQSAIPLLERYIASDISPYSVLVGRTNLAYAYVENRQYEQASKILNENVKFAQQSKNLLLQSTCLTLLAQVHIQEGEYNLAKKEIKNARALLSLTETNDHFLVTKWSLILQALEEKSLAPLVELRSLAIKLREWEGLREADFYSLRINYSRSLFLHLYFGSPFAEFRDRLAKDFGGHPVQPIYVWGAKAAPRLDLTTGKIDNFEALNPGRKCHQLLDAMTRDFYRPLRLAGLFFQLFPSERFNIATSPGRIHQIIRRTRAWIREHQIPIKLQEDQEYYSIAIEGNFSFRIPLEHSALNPNQFYLSKLKTIFAEVPFSAKEAHEKLGVSKPTVVRLVNWGMESGEIERIGVSKQSTRYVIKKTA